MGGLNLRGRRLYPNSRAARLVFPTTSLSEAEDDEQMAMMPENKTRRAGFWGKGQWQKMGVMAEGFISTTTPIASIMNCCLLAFFEGVMTGFGLDA